MAVEKLVKGTELVLEASGASISDGAWIEANDDDRQPADDAGFPLGIFEFDATGTFSVAPTAGAILELYEQKINSNSQDTPNPVDTNYPGDLLYTFRIDDSDVAQYHVSDPVPIAIDGGKYWLRWVDGGAGTASISSTWDLRMTPCQWDIS